MDRSYCLLRVGVKSRAASPTSRRAASTGRRERPARRCPASRSAALHRARHRRRRRRAPPRACDGPAPLRTQPSAPAAPPRGGHRLHPREEPLAIGLVQPVLHGEVEQVRAARAERGQQQAHPLHVEDRVGPRHRRPGAPPGPPAWSSRSPAPGPPRRSRGGTGRLTAVTRAPVGAGHGEPAEHRGGHVVRMALGPGRRGHAARRGRAARPAAALAATRPPTHAAALEPRPRLSGMRLTQRRRPPRKGRPATSKPSATPRATTFFASVVEAARRPRPPRATETPSASSRIDLVVERQGQAERVEAGPEVGGGGGHANPDAHGAENTPGPG